MKNRVVVFLLISVLAVSMLAGCQTAHAESRSAPAAAAGSTAAAAPTAATEAPAPAAAAEAPAVASEAPAPAAAPQTAAEPAVKPEEAQNIALNHAGFAADQVKRLRTEYEIDRGIPHYDVEFDEGRWEYDYEIDAATGEILSFEKDD